MWQLNFNDLEGRLKVTCGTLALVLGFALLASITLGLSYGISSTHPTYIIPGIRLVDPTFLTGDWWTENTTQYHIFFSKLVASLYSLGSLPYSLASIKISLDVLAIIAIFGVIQIICPKKTLVFFVLVIIAFFFVSHTASLQGSYFFHAYAQPSSLASTGLLIGVWLYARQRYFASGIAMAAGGLFHFNYLILVPMFFGLANLINFRERRLLFRIAVQTAPSLILVLFFLPLIFDVMGLDLSEPLRVEMFRFLSKNYAPGHYDPFYSRWQYMPFLSWIILSLPFLSRVASTNAGKRIAALYVSAASIVIVATSLSMLGFDFITRIFIWRFAPLVILLAQVIFFYGLVNHAPLRKPEPGSRVIAINWSTLAIVAVGWLGLIRYYIFMENNGGLILCSLIGLIMLLSYFLAQRRVSNTIVIGLVIFAATIISGMSIVSNPKCHYSLLANNCAPSRYELFAWARDRTNAEARFIVPPRLRAFRLLAKRPVFVDWQNIPFRPDEQKEWLRRHLLLSGLPELTSGAQADEAYSNRDPDELIQLAIQLKYKYVVLEVTQVTNFGISDSACEVFRNSEFSVVEVYRTSGNKDTYPEIDLTDSDQLDFGTAICISQPEHH